MKRVNGQGSVESELKKQGREETLSKPGLTKPRSPGAPRLCLWSNWLLPRGQGSPLLCLFWLLTE